MTDILQSDLRRIITHVIATVIYTSSDIIAIAEDDYERIDARYQGIIDAGISAIVTIIYNEKERAIGEVIDRLKSAEGIDVDIVDAAFGVEHGDL